MGLGTKESNYSTYLSIYGGEIVQEWRKEEPSADKIPAGKELQTREISMGKNAGKKIWYVGFDYVAGKLTNVKLDTEGDFGSRIILTIQDVDDNYILTLPINSSYGQSFLMKMTGIDLSKEVSFEPWQMSKEEWKKLTGRDTKNGKSGLTIKQDDEKIDNAYTKDEPNGLPELIIKKVGKETKVNDDDRMIFLYERLEEFIQAVNAADTTSSKPADGKYTDAGAPASDDNDEDYDDLPF